MEKILFVEHSLLGLHVTVYLHAYKTVHVPSNNDRNIWMSKGKLNKSRPTKYSNEYLISVVHAHGHTSSTCKLKDLSCEFPTAISWVVGDFKHSWSIDNKISGTVLK